MLLDLNDASSIVEWWAVYPQRHGALLADWSDRRPEHRSTIIEARRRIKADPSMRKLLELSRMEPQDRVTVMPPTYDEVAAGEVEAAAAS